MGPRLTTTSPQPPNPSANPYNPEPANPYNPAPPAKGPAHFGANTVPRHPAPTPLTDPANPI